MCRPFCDYLQGFTWAFCCWFREFVQGYFSQKYVIGLSFTHKALSKFSTGSGRNSKTFQRLSSAKRGVEYEIYLYILGVKDRISMICGSGFTLQINVFVMSLGSSEALLVTRVEFQVNYEIMQACIVWIICSNMRNLLYLARHNGLDRF